MINGHLFRSSTACFFNCLFDNTCHEQLESFSCDVDVVLLVQERDKCSGQIRTDEDRGSLRDFADIFVRLHDLLDACHRELALR